MITKSIVSLSIILSTFLNAQISYTQTVTTETEKGLLYFKKRNEAVGLVKTEKWQVALPVLEELTKINQNDGDLYYLSGLAYYQLQQYQNAIDALKKSLSLGGTILSGIPTGSAPSNDIMITIARAYAKAGDKSSALLWLEKGFAARYDEKPFLMGDPAFESFNQDKDFKALFGVSTKEELSREVSWEKDLLYLEKRVKELHYNSKDLAGSVSESLQDIRTNIPDLSDEQIVVEVMKVVGSFGNGHNLIIPTSPKIGALKRLPVQFYQFSDGLFIVDADDGFKKWIGYEVKAIADTPAGVALQKMAIVNARDNQMQMRWLGPYYLGLPNVLAGLGIGEDPDTVVITVTDSKAIEQLSLKPVPWNFAGFPKLPKLKDKQQPLFLSKKDDPYWYELKPEEDAIYVQFNVVAEKSEQSLLDFTRELQAKISQNNTQNLILDLRHNHGGNGELLPPVIKTVVNFEAMNPEGSIFVLAGRETFSAAQNLLTEITKYTDAIVVGEPSGSSPNHIGEAGWFRLPYSGLMGLISTQFHQTSKAEDSRIWIAPQIPVSLSSSDYFSGIDPGLNTILEFIKED